MGIITLSIPLNVGAHIPLAPDPAIPTADDSDHVAYLPVIIAQPKALEPSTNFPVATASYVGAGDADVVNAVDINLDGEIILAGVLPGYTPSEAAEFDLLGGGNGSIVRLDRLGREVLSVTRIGDDITDAEVDGNGNIVVCGDFGLARLDTSATSVAYNVDPGSVARCSAGQDGVAATLVGKQVHVYDQSGTVLGTWAIVGTAVEDVAVDGINNLIIATGWTQVGGNLQLPFIRAWNYSGELQWRSYDFDSAPSLGADTRGTVVSMGRDGKLYFAGTINGGTGVSVFSRDPKDIDVKLGKDRAVETDNYTKPTNIGSVKMSWYGRFNPVDGTLEKGQSLLTRLKSNNKGNSINIKTITADSSGRVYLAGGSSCCIKDRDNRNIADQSVGNYEGGEGFFMAVSADLTERYIWTPFAAGGTSAGGSPANGVAVRDGVVAIGATLNLEKDNRRLITHNPFQSTVSGASEGFVVVWDQ